MYLNIDRWNVTLVAVGGNDDIIFCSSVKDLAIQHHRRVSHKDRQKGTIEYQLFGSVFKELLKK